jgi:hypothetical protein
MDPTAIVNLGLLIADQAISLIKEIKGQAGMTPEQLIAQADAQDLQNAADIKALLAL